MRKHSKGDRLFDILNISLLMIVSILCFYPFYYIFIYSISSPNEVVRGGLYLWPIKPTWINYEQLIHKKEIYNSFFVSVGRTVVGTILTVICCSLFGYILTKDKLKFRVIIYRYVVITLYIQAGLIPLYMVYKNLHLINNFMVYVLPGAIAAFYIILAKTYIEQIPAAIEESAMIDGAHYWTIFIKIIFPLSMPIIATIAIFTATSQWNAWQDNFFFISNSKLRVLQLVLYDYLNNSQQMVNDSASILNSAKTNQLQVTPMSIRMTITMITTLPIILVYPLMQKYFVKGIMIGAVKG
ncbi:carbohydrate ABC transporter permease [Paenibacillus psychroresistens]|uniref:Carbohydrate ABC transporter permease n=1 Tax=Paenibacillus psychroresistens TaxID=1778678 RepID=A0A6B8RFU8_9BACL|nr:carbohydrate ABC transporter permease [Paenibacillus psychroresistens]QGQ94455.1 carbohydrate ABC transporter permease [Paenibacillus psychroresistens]